MAEESLGEAFDRIGVRPLPSVSELRSMTEDQRREQVALSIVSAAQYVQLPSWYRDEMRRRAEETIARRESEQTVTRKVS